MKEEIGNKKEMPPWDNDEYLEWLSELEDEESYNSCCEECGCYHGHHMWCTESEEYDDW